MTTRRELGDGWSKDGVIVQGISAEGAFEVPIVDQEGNLHVDISGIGLVAQLDDVRSKLEDIKNNTDSIEITAENVNVNTDELEAKVDQTNVELNEIQNALSQIEDWVSGIETNTESIQPITSTAVGSDVALDVNVIQTVGAAASDVNATVVNSGLSVFVNDGTGSRITSTSVGAARGLDVVVKEQPEGATGFKFVYVQNSGINVEDRDFPDATSQDHLDAIRQFVSGIEINTDTVEEKLQSVIENTDTLEQRLQDLFDQIKQVKVVNSGIDVENFPSNFPDTTTQNKLDDVVGELDVLENVLSHIRSYVSGINLNTDQVESKLDILDTTLQTTLNRNISNFPTNFPDSSTQTSLDEIENTLSHVRSYVSGINLNTDQVETKLQTLINQTATQQVFIVNSGISAKTTDYEKVTNADDLRTDIVYTDSSKDTASGISYFSSSLNITVVEEFKQQTEKTIIIRNVE